MTDIWVCSTCHSINRQRNTKCYKCGASQTQATGEGSTLRVENALASRTLVRYRSAWLRGLIASVLILIVTALGVLLLLMSLDYAPWLRDQLDVIVSGGTIDEEALVAKLLPAAQMGLIRLGVSIPASARIRCARRAMRSTMPSFPSMTRSAVPPTSARAWP